MKCTCICITNVWILDMQAWSATCRLPLKCLVDKSQSLRCNVVPACPELELGENTWTVGLDNLPNGTDIPHSYGSVFNVTCPPGYMFDSERYKDMPGKHGCLSLTHWSRGDFNEIFIKNFEVNFSDWWQRCLIWKGPQINVTVPY